MVEGAWRGEHGGVGTGPIGGAAPLARALLARVRPPASLRLGGLLFALALGLGVLGADRAAAQVRSDTVPARSAPDTLAPPPPDTAAPSLAPTPSPVVVQEREEVEAARAPRRAVSPAPDTLAPRGPSPRGALFRSLLLPGWGQAWVGSPGRGGVYFAMEAASLWMVYRTQVKLDEARARERWMRSTGALDEDADLPLAESRADQREDWIALAVFVALVSGADAYVAAHLQDFDERVNIVPGEVGSVRVGASIPVGRRR